MAIQATVIGIIGGVYFAERIGLRLHLTHSIAGGIVVATCDLEHSRHAFVHRLRLTVAVAQRNRVLQRLARGVAI